MKKLLIIIIFLPLFSGAQKIFTEEELHAVVEKFHPLARLAELETELAQANLVSSRGAFDPSLAYKQERKEADGSRYYNKRTVELQIPTWYGLDVVAGNQLMEGSKLNNEETRGGMNYVGLSVPLMRNLLMDKRRAVLRQAALIREQTEVERISVLNELQRDASKAYWNWWMKVEKFKLSLQALENARARLMMVRRAAVIGERAAIDTTEAWTLVLSFDQKTSEQRTEAAKAALELSIFLWTKDGNSYELPEDVVPEEKTEDQSLVLADLLSGSQNHPELAVFQFKQEILQIEKKLRFQTLLPTVDFKYKHFGRQLRDLSRNEFLNENYRVGLTIAMPLRLSEGRGAYKATRLQLEKLGWDQEYKRIKWMNELKKNFIQWEQRGLQLQQQERLVEAYKRLLNGEQTKFLNGESSLFLVNARELQAVQAMEKFFELEAERRMDRAELIWLSNSPR